MSARRDLRSPARDSSKGNIAEIFVCRVPIKSPFCPFESKIHIVCNIVKFSHLENASDNVNQIKPRDYDKKKIEQDKDRTSSWNCEGAFRRFRVLHRMISLQFVSTISCLDYTTWTLI